MTDVDARRAREALELFETICDAGLEAQRAALDEAGARDPDLRKQLEAMLATDSRRAEILDAPLFENARSAGPGATEPPLFVGGYRLGRRIGTGGMATVFEAEHQLTSERVALKLIRPLAAQRSLIMRFEVEAEALSRLKHPGIVTIFDAGSVETGGTTWPYLAMELIDGCGLMEYVRREAPPLRKRVELIALVCDAIVHAHARGVLHRDLKPANVLVDTTGTPKVIDFGIARITDQPRDQRPVTSHGGMVGTLAYMSPERVAGATDVDVRSDVYSLGVLLYETLTDELPFAAGPEPLLAAIENGYTIPLGRKNPALRGDLEQIASRALQRNPADRYQSSQVLLEDLEAYRDGRPIRARGPDALALARRWMARRPAAVASIALTLVVVLTAVLLWGSLIQRRAQIEDSLAALGSLTDILSEANDEPVTMPRRLEGLKHIARAARGLLTDRPDDPRLLDQLARTQERIGDLEMALGRVEEAAEGRREVLRMRRELSADAPGDGDRRADLSIAIVKMGDIEKHHGRLADAETWYREAYEIDRTLSEAAPENDRYLSNLQWSFERIGDIVESQGRLDEARELHERRHELACRHARLHPDDSILLRGLIESHELLYRIKGKRDEPRDHHIENAVALARQLVAREPGSARAREVLRRGLEGLAGLRGRQKLTAEATLLLRKSLEQAEKAVSLEPDCPTFRTGLTNSLRALAGAALTARDLPEARLAAEDCVDAARRAAASDSTHLRRQRQLADAHLLMARIARAESRSCDMRRHLESALAVGDAIARSGSPRGRRLCGEILDAAAELGHDSPLQDRYHLYREEVRCGAAPGCVIERFVDICLELERFDEAASALDEALTRLRPGSCATRARLEKKRTALEKTSCNR